MRRLAAFCLFGCLALWGAAPEASAQERQRHDLLRAGDPGVLDDGGTIVVGDPCDALTVHEPAPDVAYRPSIGANGEWLVPADLCAEAPPLIAPDH
jgi:hypothetical protein